MKLSGLLNKNLIVTDIKAKTKKDAIAELVDVLRSQVSAIERNDVLSEIMARESQQSTYLGHGLAMPHARVEKLDDFLIVCGKSKDGIDYPETKDKIKFLFIILSCKTKINTLLQTMGALARLFSDNKSIEALSAADTPSAFINVIEKSGIQIKQQITAADIMRKETVTVKENQTLKEVIDLFFEKNISGTPVVDKDNKVIGVVTEKELISLGIPEYMTMMDDISFLSDSELFEDFFKKEDEILVKDIYSKKFTFVHSNVSVIQIAFYFVNKSCRRILVLDDEKRLLGLIMRKDLIRKVIHA